MDVHRERRFTLLITSHNMSEIERLCRRVVFVAQGRVVADGSPAEIVSRYGAADLEGTFLTIAAGGGPAHGEGSVDARHGGGGPVNGRRVLAIFRRNYYVALHSPPMVFDLLLWPLLDLMIWGLLDAVHRAEPGRAPAAGRLPAGRRPAVGHPVPRQPRRVDLVPGRRVVVAEPDQPAGVAAPAGRVPLGRAAVHDVQARAGMGGDDPGSLGAVRLQRLPAGVRPADAVPRSSWCSASRSR